MEQDIGLIASVLVQYLLPLRLLRLRFLLFADYSGLQN